MVHIEKIAQFPDDARRTPNQQDAVRAHALKRLKKRRDFAGHVMIYVLVNAFLVVIWAMTSHGFFWPIFPMVGWGIGVAMNAWDVWRGDEFSDEQIAREMQRITASK